MISNVDQAVPVVRILMQKLGCDAEAAARQLLLPEDVRIQVLEHFEQERLIHILDPYMILDRNRTHVEWLPHVDRATWYYWPRVRDYFLGVRNLPEATVNSVDDVTDRVLAAMENPAAGNPFTTKGLVLGYVQSGKTTNYSALIAKGADVGFRLFIVLSGIHNGLRLQTERRLRNELVAPQGVAPLDATHAWKTFTKAQMDGDFDPGSVDAAGLASPGPGLLVVKKWKSVLDKLLLWIEQLPPAVRNQIPVMIIDDEADQATPNTGGNRADPDEDADDVVADEAEPSKINDRIRRLVKSFPKVGYVAYTATPFANVFIDHTAMDQGREDLYPRDFIVDLPMPDGYFGAERIFGRADDDTDEGLDVLRTVPDEEEKLLRPAKRDPMFEPQLTDSLRQAFDDFVLAGAAMFERGGGDKPASMLIHTSLYTAVQERLAQLITEDLVDRVKAEWRYKRKGGIEARLRARWESDFRRVTRSIDAAADRPFEAVRDHITTFLELLDVRSVNSASEEILDYDADADLKVVVIGGNRLSRGLTLENLLVSYYLRPANQYDTLMQMGRWFGFRDGYVDLTRIYTTAKLMQWFRDLATVEVELREEIARYDREKLTPLDFAVRVRKHPSLLPTSPSKMKWTDTLQLSFDRQLQQTITFPFDDGTGWLRRNVETTRGFLSGLGKPTDQAGTSQPFWRHVPAKQILEFLLVYQMDPKATRVKADLLRRYIRAQASMNELTDWIVAVVGLNTTDQRLGTIDLHVLGQGPINAMERTRIKNSVTLKAIVSAEDEATGLTKEQRAAAEGTTGKAFRSKRDPKEGLLLIYPISRMSGFNTPRPLGETRRPIFDTPEEARRAEDIIGVGLSFPHSDSAATVEYVIGTVGEGAAT